MPDFYQCQLSGLEALPSGLEAALELKRGHFAKVSLDLSPLLAYSLSSLGNILALKKNHRESQGH